MPGVARTRFALPRFGLFNFSLTLHRQRGNSLRTQ